MNIMRRKRRRRRRVSYTHKLTKDSNEDEIHNLDSPFQDIFKGWFQHQRCSFKSCTFELSELDILYLTTFLYLYYTIDFVQ